ncbi:hypothetical protein H0G86_007959 [Trichoderma simmonsii]|uniref:Uncharacterized protein n=1 Tax=Trichoderma simmonsii TaxID=1491479 RepID=A0A8G0LJN0_9HYPO|nr:hypothetical protein H0G86_007959 [Trichoderma simmonsii]
MLPTLQCTAGSFRSVTLRTYNLPLHTSRTIGFYLQSTVGLKASHPKTRQKTKCNSTVGHSSNTVGSLNGVCPELLRTKARSGRASLRSNLWNKGEEIPVLGEPEAAAARPGLTLIM